MLCLLLDRGDGRLGTRQRPLCGLALGRDT